MDIGHGDISIGHDTAYKSHSIRRTDKDSKDIVFDKSIFSILFYKDIRRVYIYKKAEGLASALYLITPAFRESPSLKSRAEAIAGGLTDAASMPPTLFRDVLARELLALSSMLSVARVGGLLSSMNADLMLLEVRSLLDEVASYEEPRLDLPEVPGLSVLTRETKKGTGTRASPPASQRRPEPNKELPSTRQASIMSFISEKGRVSIKDISLVIRGVSEKTIQRELQALIEAGQVVKQGERRWSTYSPA